MIIKKFQGKTEAEAVESAKKELGDGIVIMNVRNVKKKGMFSFLKPQMVEVTVALEEEPVRPGTVPEKDLNLTDAIANIRSVSEKALQQEAAGKKEQGSQEEKHADSTVIEENCFIIPCWKMKSMKNMPTRSLMKLKNPTSRTCRLTMHFPISTRK